jgi:hypothetical protein
MEKAFTATEDEQYLLDEYQIDDTNFLRYLPDNATNKTHLHPHPIHLELVERGRQEFVFNVSTQETRNTYLQQRIRTLPGLSDLEQDEPVDLESEDLDGAMEWLSNPPNTKVQLGIPEVTRWDWETEYCNQIFTLPLKWHDYMAFLNDTPTSSKNRLVPLTSIRYKSTDITGDLAQRIFARLYTEQLEADQPRRTPRVQLSQIPAKWLREIAEKSVKPITEEQQDTFNKLVDLLREKDIVQLINKLIWKSQYKHFQALIYPTIDLRSKPAEPVTTSTHQIVFTVKPNFMVSTIDTVITKYFEELNPGILKNLHNNNLIKPKYHY